MKRLIKTDHNNTGIYIQIRKPYFRKHVENFANVIRKLPRLYSFSDLPRSQPAFPLNNFLLIPGKVVICFPIMFFNFILVTMATPDRSFVFMKPLRFTEVDYFTVNTINFINDIAFIFCSYLIFRFIKEFMQSAFSVEK